VGVGVGGGGGGVCMCVCGCRCGKKYVGLFLTWQHSPQPILPGFSPINSLGPKTPECTVWVNIQFLRILYTNNMIYMISYDIGVT